MGSYDGFIVNSNGLSYEEGYQKLSSTGKYSCLILTFKAMKPGKYTIELNTAALKSAGYTFIGTNQNNNNFKLSAHSDNYIVQYDEYNTIGFDPAYKNNAMGWEIYEKAWWKSSPRNLVIEEYSWIANTMPEYKTYGEFDIPIYIYTSNDLKPALTSWDNARPRRDPNGNDASGSNRYMPYNIYSTFYVQKITKSIHDISIRITVPDIDFPVGKIRVNVPYPYKQFTDTEFFLTDKLGRLIPERYYTLINNRKTVQFIQGSPIGIAADTDVRFTFAHNKERYHINKFEQSFAAKAGQYIYDIQSPHGKILDLDIRYLVFFKKYQLNLVNNEYTIDNFNGKIKINPNYTTIKGGEEISIVCFYTGTPERKTVASIPMSGYIELKRNKIDRNYNNNLMAVFVNGKLISRDKIIHISNNLYKIKEDIKSRYNLDVRNMSPKISSLVPFYKENTFDQTLETKHYTGDLLNFQITVPDDNYTEKQNRFRMDDMITPIMIDPSILKTIPNPVFYISFYHHGINDEFNENTLMYTLNTYATDYTKSQSDIRVMVSLLYKTTTSEDEHNIESPTKILAATIPHSLSQVPRNSLIFSMPVKKIYVSDTANNTKKLESIIVKLEINESHVDRPEYIYYTLESSNFEHNDYVGIFEFTVSTGPDSSGMILYRKHLDLIPTNKNEIFKNIEEGLI